MLRCRWARCFQLRGHWILPLTIGQTTLVFHKWLKFCSEAAPVIAPLAQPGSVWQRRHEPTLPRKHYQKNDIYRHQVRNQQALSELRSEWIRLTSGNLCKGKINNSEVVWLPIRSSTQIQFLLVWCTGGPYRQRAVHRECCIGSALKLESLRAIFSKFMSCHIVTVTVNDVEKPLAELRQCLSRRIKQETRSTCFRSEESRPDPMQVLHLA